MTLIAVMIEVIRDEILKNERHGTHISMARARPAEIDRKAIYDRFSAARCAPVV
jgi:hypothetical protein